jgi:hypothetical protein
MTKLEVGRLKIQRWVKQNPENTDLNDSPPQSPMITPRKYR